MTMPPPIGTRAPQRAPERAYPGYCRRCGHHVTANANPNGTGTCIAPVPGDPDAVCGCECSYFTEAETGVPW